MRYYGKSKARGENTDFVCFLEKLIGESLAKVSTDFSDGRARLFFQEQLLVSAEKKVPYRYLGECYCGENKFYILRREFYTLVAKGLGIFE